MIWRPDAQGAHLLLVPVHLSFAAMQQTRLHWGVETPSRRNKLSASADGDLDRMVGVPVAYATGLRLKAIGTVVVRFSNTPITSHGMRGRSRIGLKCFIAPRCEYFSRLYR